MVLFDGLGEYIGAVRGHWVSLVSGSLLTTLLWFLSTRFEKPWFRKLGYILGVIFIWFAMFQAWQDQRVSYSLSCQIEAVGGGNVRLVDADETVTGLFMLVRVRNPGPPSTADNWQLRVRAAFSDYDGTLQTLPERTTIIGSNGLSQFTKEQSLIEKAVAQPIPQGGQLAGVLLFGFEDLTPQQLIDSIRISSVNMRLTVRDISGIVRVCEDISTFDTRMPAVTPGIEQERRGFTR